MKEIRKKDIEISYSGMSFEGVLPGTAIIGQERAMSLLELGLSLDRVGYNIMLSGNDGSGRLTAVLEKISLLENDTSKLKDVAYGYSPSGNPSLLIFEKGGARRFNIDLGMYANGSISKESFIDKWPSFSSFISSLPPFSENSSAYTLNVVIDNSSAVKRPTIIESHPSHKSLFGYIEKGKEKHLSIRVGSYQAAAGGFLIIGAEELLGDDSLSKTVMRYLVMTHRALTSDNVPGEMMGNVRPAPIPILTKIILLGNERTYEKLVERDEKFLRYFRIAPQFDYIMKATEENIRGTVSYLKSVGKTFLPAKDGAYSEILRYSSFLAEERESLSAELSMLGDLFEEANENALLRNSKSIEASDVSAALEKRSWHASLEEYRINEEIKKGSLVISLSGSKVGIVNGLAVIDRGTSSFGTPCVISVAVAPGTEGIVNIEHEAGLSGGIHDKGLLILEGYLRKYYADTFPLSFYAGICFEQSYGEVDGDSASLSELYALLSAISEVPVRQDIAVTGSVSQMGDIQPVGGINEKIEGFFNACSVVGLNGKQGVIIPEQNTHSLILPGFVEDAIERGIFHIYAISDLEEGIELLTGMETGKRNKNGSFPASSFNKLVEDGLKKLRKYAKERG